VEKNRERPKNTCVTRTLHLRLRTTSVKLKVLRGDAGDETDLKQACCC